MNDDYEDNDYEFRQRKQMEKEAKEKFAKDQIKYTVKTSIMTCAVGALSDMEKIFGDLCGIGKDYNELTKEQKEFKRKWTAARNSILERASNGIKISFRDLDRCHIQDYNRKKYNITLKNKDNRNGR